MFDTAKEKIDVYKSQEETASDVLSFYENV